MSDTMQAVSRSLSNDVETLATIAHNVANLRTPGYRAQRNLPGFAASLEHAARIEQSDGALEQTSRELDLALRGPGFFIIERDGKRLLARSGAFKLDGESRLTTSTGELVMGQSGSVVVVGKEVAIGDDGQIRVDGNIIDKLQIVAVSDAALVRPAGRNAYAYEGELIEWRGRLVQGALEGANVDPADQTVSMMETTRHAESVQKVISIYDNALETGIKQIGSN